MSEARILVVDDEEVVLRSVAKALRSDPFDVETALSAEEALRLIDQTEFELVITDLMMPEIDGLQLLKRLGEFEPPPLTIVITGYPTIKTALTAKRLGAFEYVTKPFTRQELRSVVVRALRSRDARPQRNDRQATGEDVAPMYYIPDHSWARQLAPERVEIGAAALFAGSVGQLAEVELPSPGEFVEQGRVCVTLRATDSVEHQLHSPLSGSVTELNPDLALEPDRVVSDPEGGGWLFRLLPTDLAKELRDLVPG